MASVAAAAVAPEAIKAAPAIIDSISGVVSSIINADANAEKARREQDRLDRQLKLNEQKIEKDYELKVKELDRKKEKDQQDHEAEMERIKNKADKEQIELLNEMIKDLQNTQDRLLGKQKESKKELESEKEQLKITEEDIEKFKKEKEANLALIQKDIDKIWNIYKSNNVKIQDCIDHTNVDENNIPQFLRLINDGLLPATLINQQQTDKLTVKLKVFRDVMTDECSDILTIKTYFESPYIRLQRLVDGLKQEDYLNLSELEFTNQNEYNELIDSINKYIENNEENKKQLTTREKNKFRRCCKIMDVDEKNNAEACWVKDANDKKEVSKTRLLEISPIFAVFFGNMNNAMDQVNKILIISSQQTLNMAQQEAIKSKQENKNKLKQIKLREEEVNIGGDGDGDDNKDDNKDDANKDGDDAKDNKQLTKLDKLNEQSNTLQVAAIVKLHVVDSMESEFNPSDNENSRIIRASSKTSAEHVENCCLQIIEAQSIIRKTVLLAMELLEYKPPSPTPKAEPLWKSIDQGITQIFENAIAMNKISAEFFGYFVRFKQGFEHFISTIKIKADISLLIALEGVTKVIGEFNEFQLDVEKTVIILRDSAMKIIENCVKQTAGAKQYEDAQKKRKEAEQEWKRLKKQYNEEQFRTTAKYEQLRSCRAKLNAQIAANEFTVTANDKQYESNDNVITDYRDQMKIVRNIT